MRVGKRDNHIIDAKAPSAARVVYDYYGGAERLPNISPAMMAAVDKGDSAQFTRDEILDPQGWDLLNFLMDARTGLGRFRQFRISNYQLMMQLIDFCRNHDADEILGAARRERARRLYRAHAASFKAQLLRCGSVHDNLVVLDLRNEETIWSGNRFMIYALYPQCNISIHQIWGRQKQNMVFACGKSILDRSCTTNVGELMLRYGGGGHHAAGTCQVDTPEGDRVLARADPQDHRRPCRAPAPLGVNPSAPRRVGLPGLPVRAACSRVQVGFHLLRHVAHLCAHVVVEGPLAQLLQDRERFQVGVLRHQALHNLCTRVEHVLGESRRTQRGQERRQELAGHAALAHGEADPFELGVRAQAGGDPAGVVVWAREQPAPERQRELPSSLPLRPTANKVCASTTCRPPKPTRRKSAGRVLGLNVVRCTFWKKFASSKP